MTGTSTRNVRLAWWREARFGMFVHWGLYSVLGGEWQGQDYGKEMGGRSAEWIMLKADIPNGEYRAISRRFNPVAYDPRAWARAAKAAGMGYMVLTAKHHDGFCLFKTATTAWNSVQASPCGLDLLKPYVDALRSEGLRVGFYYSHRIDWMYRHKGEHHEPMPLPDSYIEMVRTQLTELCTRYGPIDLFWFDMGMDEEETLNRMCHDIVRRYQPGAVISERIGSGLGDYRCLPDRGLPPAGTTGDCESPMTLRMNWGYDRDDISWKSPALSVRMISQCACRGTNLLLNMAPQPDGCLAPEEQETLRFMGNWMAENAEAIQATVGSPFAGEYPWGSLTLKKDGSQAFLHVWHYATDVTETKLMLGGIRGAVRSVYIRGRARKNLVYDQNPDSGLLTVTLPTEAIREWCERYPVSSLSGVPSWLEKDLQVPVLITVEFSAPLQMTSDIVRQAGPQAQEYTAEGVLKTYPVRGRVHTLFPQGLALIKANGSRLSVGSACTRYWNKNGDPVSPDSILPGMAVLAIVSPSPQNEGYGLAAEHIVVDEAPDAPAPVPVAVETRNEWRPFHEGAV